MSDAEDPTETTPTTESGDAVADAPDESTADPVRTVTRKGAAIGMAGALLAGGLIGWLGAAAFDDDTQPISAVQDGRFGEGEGPGGMPGGPGGGGFPGGGGMPGGQWEGDGERPTPPWMDEDGDDRRDEYDESEDQDEQEQSDDEDQPDESDTDEQGNQDQSDDA